jgi:hypothetical protein
VEDSGNSKQGVKEERELKEADEVAGKAAAAPMGIKKKPQHRVEDFSERSLQTVT